MRELHVRVRRDEELAVRSVLEDHDIDYTTIHDGDESHFMFPLPTAAVSSVLDGLEDAGIGSETYTVVTGVEFARTPGFDELRAQYEDTPRKLSKQELHAKMNQIQWPYQIYYLGSVLSAIAATAGLLLDQPALVIGAMVIAPQVSSGLAAPAGVLLGDWEMLVSSVREQAFGLGLAIVGAGLFAWLVRVSGFVPANTAVAEIELLSLRLAPTFLSTVGAFVAGIVGAFGYTTEQSTSLVGVMIAAALIPAAAAVGIAAAWAAPLFGFGAFLLLLVNALAINLGAMATLPAMGYRPEWSVDGNRFRASIPSPKRAAVYGSLLALVLATVLTGVLTATNIVFARQVSEEVESTMADDAYEDISIVNVQAGYGGYGSGFEPTNVTVSARRTTGETYPQLPDRLERRIEERTGRDVRVTVTYSQSRTANASRPAPGIADVPRSGALGPRPPTPAVPEPPSARG